MGKKSRTAAYGAGHRRAVVLGGGGVVFVAWLTAYLAELARRGVDARRGIVDRLGRRHIAGAADRPCNQRV